MALLNDRFLRACLKQSTDRTPIWLMRQAGRYLPEYNATRAVAGSFLALAKNPQLATEVTLQPLDRYPLDAAILFSDILTIPDAMGLGLSFEAGEGPRFSRPLRDEQAVNQLKPADLNQLKYVFDAVSEIRKALTQNGQQRVPLIGFSGSPWTLACYMIEGSGSSDFRYTKEMMYQRPDLMKKVLDANIQSVADYLKAQVDAGAQALMIFDTWGGLLPDGWYQKTSLASMKAVIERLPRQKDGQQIPVLVFTKGGGIWLEDIAHSGADVIGLDWTASVAKSRKRLLANKTPLALQGNFDPLALFANPDQVKTEAKRILDELAEAPALDKGLHALDGHVFNLGHGISQFTNPEHVTALVETVLEHSTKLRS